MTEHRINYIKSILSDCESQHRYVQMSHAPSRWLRVTKLGRTRIVVWDMSPVHHPITNVINVK